MAKFLDDNGLLYLWGKIKDKFVAKETGKGLSTNDYTTTEKNKLANIAANANNYSLPNASASTLGGIKVGAGLTINDAGQLSTTGGGVADSVEWTGVLNTPTTLAGYGITDVASGAEVNVQSDWSVTSTSSDAYIKNKPTKVSDFTNDSGFITSSAIADKADRSTSLSGYGITDAYTKSEVDTAVGAKASKATSLSGYGITDAYTKTEIDTKLSSVYKPQGTVTFASLPSMSDNTIGYVYNVSDAFTTTANFVEGVGKKFEAGTNVVCVKIGGVLKWDVLAGSIQIDTIANGDIDTIVAS